MTKFSQSLLFAAFLALAACLAAPTQARGENPPRPGQWVQIFNGTNLDGWTPKITGYPLGTNFANTFRVEDGLLKVSYSGYTNFTGQFGHLFWKEKLSNYVLRVEYRFVGKQVPGGPGWAFRNSGVMIHGEDPRGMELNQDFPASIEVQLLGGSGEGKRTTANLCTPGTDVVMGDQLITAHCTDSTSKTYHGDRWVTVQIEVHGSRLIKHIVEGETVLSYKLPQYEGRDARTRRLIESQGKIIEGGTISLQSESHPVEFRKVELLRLE